MASMQFPDFENVWGEVLSRFDKFDPNYVGEAFQSVAFSQVLYKRNPKLKVLSTLSLLLARPLLNEVIAPLTKKTIRKVEARFASSDQESTTPESPKEPTLHEVIEKGVIIGHNHFLTLGSVLTFPFLEVPPVYLAIQDVQEKKWSYKQIKLESVNPAHYPEHKQVITLLRVLLFAKTLLKVDLSALLAKTVLHAGLSKLYPEESPEYKDLFQLFSKVAAGLGSAYGVGMLLKRYALNNYPELEGLLTVDSQERSRQAAELPDPPGAFVHLPLELIVHIRNRLGRVECSRLARTCSYFRYVCNVLDINKKYVEDHYHSALIPPIGLNKLASLPVLDLKTKVVDPGTSLSEAEWDEITLSLRYPKSELAVAENNEALTNYAGVQYFCHDFRDIPIIRKNLTKLATVAPENGNGGHPLIHFVQAPDMGNHPMMRFVDDLGRHGILFQFDYAYTFPRFTTHTGRGVLILHQLDPKNKQGTWVLIYKMGIEFRHYTLHNICHCSKHLTASSLQWVMFLHQFQKEMGPECNGNLKWLHDFSSGKRCGLPSYGNELRVVGAPTLQLVNPKKSWFQRLLQKGV